MAEAPSNRLPSGHDDEFAREVEDDFHCLICHLPLKQPVQTRCGHRFCKECLEEHLRRQELQAQHYTCPADREGLDRDRDVFPDKATERKILSFAIKCPREDCDWTGELRNKEVHLATCPFKVVSCTNKNCHMTLKRKDLEQHVTITCEWRIIECEYCKEPHPECHMQDHVGKCTKFPVTCPNSCGDSIPREMIVEHIKNVCLLTFVSCPYVHIGCDKRVQRKNVELHLQSDMREHLDFACVKMNNTQIQLNETQAQLNNTQVQLSLTENNFRETTRNLEEKVEALQKQLEKKQMKDQDNGYTRFVWKIHKFSEIWSHVKAEEKEKISSAPFCTESYGYKLKLTVYPNGCRSAKNTHLSVFIVVMKGEYDAILPWPFNKKVKFTLIDQQEDTGNRENVVYLLNPKPSNRENFARPKGVENDGLGQTNFISHEELLTRRYLVDDTLFLQVEILSHDA